MRHDLQAIDCSPDYVRYLCAHCGRVFRVAKDFNPEKFDGECGTPTIVRQAKNLAQDGWKWAKSGFKLSDREERDLRLGICLTCAEYRGGKCSRCGCKCEWKSWLRTSRCPLDKWAVQPPAPTARRRGYWLRPKGDEIRVGILSPTLMMGGAEMWAVSTCRSLGGDGVRVEGLGVVDLNGIDEGNLRRASEACEVYEGTQGILRLSRACDAILTWGIHDLSVLAGYEGVVVQVGQGHCDWTVSVVNNAIPYTTHWVAVSKNAAKSFPDPSSVTIIHNPIDVGRCRIVESREVVRARWGLRPDEIVVGYVGRLGLEKNPLANVRAVKVLGPPYRAVWVGGGVYTGDVLQKGHKALPGLIYQPSMENVGDAYRALDCFVLASPSEGFSLAMAEAWYCGCPMVHTPVGGTEVQEQFGPMGVEVPIDPTPEQIADAVKKAVSPENQPTVLKAARIAAEHFTDEAIGRRWRDYLREIFNESRTRDRAEDDAQADVLQRSGDVQV